MCGFVVLVPKHNIEIQEFKEILNSIKHRGPDNLSIWKDESSNLHMGHVRLSIIDLNENSNQPFLSQCGNFLLVFNGEIYNFKEIKQKYFSPSKIWKTNSDTELLIELLIEIGPERALNEIDGQFAFVLYDKNKKELTLGRDLAGEKPIYYGIENGNLLITSDLKVLEHCDFFHKKLNFEAVNAFKLFNFINQDRSIFQSFKKLKPGYFSIIDLTKLRIKHLQKYLNYTVDNSFSKLSIKEITNYTEELLILSLKRKIVSDVPISLMLSSGVDSSLILLLLKEKLFKKIETYTVSFSNKNLNEINQAKKFADRMNVKNNEVTITDNEIVKYTDVMSSIFSEPFADASQIPIHFLSKSISKNYKVSLTGDGADEIFSGYNRHKLIYKIQSFNIYQKKTFNILLKMFKSNTIKTIYNLLFKILPANYQINTFINKSEMVSNFNFQQDDYEIYSTFIFNFANFINDKQTYLLFSNEIKNNWIYFKRDFPNSDIASIYDFHDYLPNNIFVKSDRSSMFSSLELRTPYISKDLINLGNNLTSSLRFKAENKKLLREILNNNISNFKFSIAKKGFTPPISDWLMRPLKEWSEDNINSEYFKQNPLLNHTFIKKKWNEHKSGSKDNSQIIWNILVLANWLKNNNYTL